MSETAARQSKHATAGSRPTRSVLLGLIRRAGRISRPELAEATALTQTSNSIAVRQLIDAGLVREAGVGGRTGGKRRTLLEIDPRARFGVGISIDFQGSTVCAVDMSGYPLGFVRGGGADEDSPDEVIARLARDVTACTAAAGIDWGDVIGVGVAAPGPVDLAHGRAVQLPSAQIWREMPLRDRLAAELGSPVWLDNDANAAAVGEYWSGDVENSRAFAVMYLDKGIGAGIMIDGDLVRGASSNAGEIGHLSVDMNGERCHCGNHGCLERMAAPYMVELEYLARTCLELPAPRIGELALAGDPVARELLTRAGNAVAVAALGTANLLDLELIVLSGPGFGPALPLMLDAVRGKLEDAFFARRAHPVRAIVSARPTESAAIGAATLALRAELGH